MKKLLILLTACQIILLIHGIYMLINKEYLCGTLQSVGSITMIILNIKTLKRI